MTTKATTKDQIIKLLDVLDPGAKSCEYCIYGGKVPALCEYCGCEYTRGIFIGDILQKIRDKGGMIIIKQDYGSILMDWGQLGYNKSLQEIVEGHWEVDCDTCEGVCELPCHAEEHQEKFKTYEANSLFDYLITLFL